MCNVNRFTEHELVHSEQELKNMKEKPMKRLDPIKAFTLMVLIMISFVSAFMVSYYNYNMYNLHILGICLLIICLCLFVVSIEIILLHSRYIKIRERCENLEELFMQAGKVFKGTQNVLESMYNLIDNVRQENMERKAKNYE